MIIRFTTLPGVAAVTTALVFAQTQFKSEVRLVEIYASVHDRQGNPLDGLERERFRIFDNGEPQPIYSFEPTSNDVTCAILLDTTGSMRDALGAVKNGVSNLIDHMRAGDSVGVFGFSTSLTTLQDFTTDKDAAKRAVQRTRAGGGTALFDAIADLTHQIESRQGKKVIILFTDGADNASKLRADAITQRSLNAGIPVFAVAEGEATHESQLLKQLENLSAKTGGTCYRARSSKDIAKVFADIQGALQHVYLISFRPPSADETKWRTIKLEVSGLKDYTVHGKQGYFPH